MADEYAIDIPVNIKFTQQGLDEYTNKAIADINRVASAGQSGNLTAGALPDVQNQLRAVGAAYIAAAKQAIPDNLVGPALQKANAQFSELANTIQTGVLQAFKTVAANTGSGALGSQINDELQARAVASQKAVLQNAKLLGTTPPNVFDNTDILKSTGSLVSPEEATQQREAFAQVQEALLGAAQTLRRIAAIDIQPGGRDAYVAAITEAAAAAKTLSAQIRTEVDQRLAVSDTYIQATAEGALAERDIASRIRAAENARITAATNASATVRTSDDQVAASEQRLAAAIDDRAAANKRAVVEPTPIPPVAATESPVAKTSELGGALQDEINSILASSQANKDYATTKEGLVRLYRGEVLDAQTGQPDPTLRVKQDTAGSGLFYTTDPATAAAHSDITKLEGAYSSRIKAVDVTLQELQSFRKDLGVEDAFVVSPEVAERAHVLSDAEAAAALQLRESTQLTTDSNTRAAAATESVEAALREQVNAARTVTVADQQYALTKEGLVRLYRGMLVDKSTGEPDPRLRSNDQETGGNFYTADISRAQGYAAGGPFSAQLEGAYKARIDAVDVTLSELKSFKQDLSEQQAFIVPPDIATRGQQLSEAEIAAAEQIRQDTRLIASANDGVTEALGLLSDSIRSASTTREGTAERAAAEAKVTEALEQLATETREAATASVDPDGLRAQREAQAEVTFAEKSLAQVIREYEATAIDSPERVSANAAVIAAQRQYASKVDDLAALTTAPNTEVTQQANAGVATAYEKLAASVHKEIDAVDAQVATVYHGTTQAQLPDILKQGLLVSKTRTFESVFGTEDPAVALQHARETARATGSTPAVVSYPKPPDSQVGINDSVLSGDVASENLTRENVKKLAAAVRAHADAETAATSSVETDAAALAEAYRAQALAVHGVGTSSAPIEANSAQLAEALKTQAAAADASVAQERVASDAVATARARLTEAILRGAASSQNGDNPQAAFTNEVATARREYVESLRAQTPTTDTAGLLAQNHAIADVVTAETAFARKVREAAATPEGSVARAAADTAVVEAQRQYAQKIDALGASVVGPETEPRRAADAEVVAATERLAVRLQESIAAVGTENEAGAQANLDSARGELASAYRSQAAVTGQGSGGSTAPVASANAKLAEGIEQEAAAESRATESTLQRVEASNASAATQRAANEKTLEAQNLLVQSIHNAAAASSQNGGADPQGNLRSQVENAYLEVIGAVREQAEAANPEAFRAQGQVSTEIVSAENVLLSRVKEAVDAVGTENESGALAKVAAAQEALASRYQAQADAAGTGAGGDGGASVDSANAKLAEGLDQAAASAIDQAEKTDVAALLQREASNKVSDAMNAAAAKIAEIAAISSDVPGGILAYATAQADATFGEKLLAQQIATETAEREAASDEYLGLVRRAAAAQATVNAAIEGQAEQLRAGNVAGGAGLPPDWFQKLQASIFNRQSAASQRDASSFQQLPQFLAQKALTTGGFALSGAAFYGTFTAIKNAVSEANKFQTSLVNLEAEFKASDTAGEYPHAKQAIIDLSNDTGLAASEIAAIAVTFKGAFGDTTRAVNETREAVQLAIATGLGLGDVTNTVLAVDTAFGVTAQDIGDVTLSLQELTGVSAKETITALGQIAPVADQVGLSLKQTASLLALSEQLSGRSAQGIAENFTRVLPAIQKNGVAILDLVGQVPGLDAEFQKLGADLSSGSEGAFFTDLTQSFAKLGPVAQNTVIELLGGRREAGALIPVLQNAAKYNDLVANATDHNGKTQAYAAQQMATLSGQLRILSTDFRNFIGDILRGGLATGLTDIAHLASIIFSAFSDVASVLKEINQLTDGFAGHLATIALSVKAISALRGILSARGATNEVANAGVNAVGETTLASGIILPKGVAGAAGIEAQSAETAAAIDTAATDGASLIVTQLRAAAAKIAGAIEAGSGAIATGAETSSTAGIGAAGGAAFGAEAGAIGLGGVALGAFAGIALFKANLDALNSEDKHFREEAKKIATKVFDNKTESDRLLASVGGVAPTGATVVTPSDVARGRGTVDVVGKAATDVASSDLDSLSKVVKAERDKVQHDSVKEFDDKYGGFFNLNRFKQEINPLSGNFLDLGFLHKGENAARAAGAKAAQQAEAGQVKGILSQFEKIAVAGTPVLDFSTFQSVVADETEKTRKQYIADYLKSLGPGQSAESQQTARKNIQDLPDLQANINAALKAKGGDAVKVAGAQFSDDLKKLFALLNEGKTKQFNELSEKYIAAIRVTNPTEAASVQAALQAAKSAVSALKNQNQIEASLDTQKQLYAAGAETAATYLTNLQSEINALQRIAADGPLPPDLQLQLAQELKEEADTVNSLASQAQQDAEFLAGLSGNPVQLAQTKLTIAQGTLASLKNTPGQARSQAAQAVIQAQQEAFSQQLSTEGPEQAYRDALKGVQLDPTAVNTIIKDQKDAIAGEKAALQKQREFFLGQIEKLDATRRGAGGASASATEKALHDYRSKLANTDAALKSVSATPIVDPTAQLNLDLANATRARVKALGDFRAGDDPVKQAQSTLNDAVRGVQDDLTFYNKVLPDDAQQYYKAYDDLLFAKAQAAEQEKEKAIQLQIDATRNPEVKNQLTKALAATKAAYAASIAKIPGHSEDAKNAANDAASTQISATNDTIDTQNAIAKARLDLLAAGTQDAVQLAKIAILQADEEAREAQASRNRADQLEAAAHKLQAQHQLADALSAEQDALDQYLTAVANFNGDVVKAADIAVAEAKRHLAEAIAQGKGTTVIRQDQANVVNALAAQRDTVLQSKEETIDFNLQIKKISTAQAIALYTALLSSKNTVAEQRDLLLKIQQLKDTLGQDLQFNLPTDLQLPTLYEARRFNQGGGASGFAETNATGGGGQNFNDNRVITIAVNGAQDTKAVVADVVAAINAPPRNGVRPRIY